MPTATDDFLHEREYLTVAEVAQQLAAHPETVRRWLKSGALPGTQIGGPHGTWRIRRESLERLGSNP